MCIYVYMHIQIYTCMSIYHIYIFFFIPACISMIDHPDAVPASRASSPNSSAIPSPFMRSRATTPSNHGRPSSKSGKGLSGGVNTMGRSSPFNTERERSSRERSSTAPNSLLSTTRKGTAKFTLTVLEDNDHDVARMNRNSKPRRNSEGKADDSKSRKFSKKNSLEFMKGCILCEQQFPKSAMQTRIMWKHILDLRLVVQKCIYIQIYVHENVYICKYIYHINMCIYMYI
jgi:hypothetical protein